MTAAGRYVTTADIRDAVRDRETDLLDALNIDWRAGHPHIACPYQDHADDHPSWRWDQRKARAFCTCGSYSILDVLMKVEGVAFDQAKIRAAELLKRPDLIRERGKRKPRGRGGLIPPEQQCNRATRPGRCTIAALSEAKKLPVSFLQSLGLRDCSYLSAPAIRIPYFAADGGEELAIRFRVALDGPDHYRWRKGSKARLYGLARLSEVHKVGSVAIVEGETDCFTLWYAEFPALGLPGATIWNEERDAPLLDGIATIYVVVEPDQGGKQMLAWLAKSRIRDRVWLVRLDGFKDPSALYLDDPERFCGRWRAALDAAEPFQAIAERESAERADKARATANDLILDPLILARFAAELPRAGLVGEDRNAKILFLVLTTRLFDRPVSVAIKGPSSGGKSYTVEVVLRFFPPSAYWERTAMSDRALAYSDEDFRHRHLVIYEAAGMTSDIASYLIRSLLSEGRIEYELVEKTQDGIRARVITKDGPTGLIVTTTKAKLHPENETRLLSLSVKDTAEQTSMIFHALAARGDAANAPDFARWQAFQDWLATGEHRVVVPFGRRLAELIPPVAVRLRRDFRLLLTLIEAHALLHRERRDKDNEGRIIATVDDYAAVRELVADLLSEGVDAAVKKETRETIDAVKRLAKDEVSVTEIAKTLNMDKGAASRRVREAVEGGFLVNAETRKGLPSRISLGDPLPVEIEILPHPDKLADRCSVAALLPGYNIPPSPASVKDAAADISPLAEVEI
jgi:hypothetical protein